MEPADNNTPLLPQTGESSQPRNKRRAESPASPTEPASKRQQTAQQERVNQEFIASFINAERARKAAAEEAKRRPKFTKEERMEMRRKWDEETKLKAERRKGMTPEAWLREEGDRLLPRLRRDEAKITLQKTPVSYNGGAKCRAYEDCLFKRDMEDEIKEFEQDEGKAVPTHRVEQLVETASKIKDDARIRIHEPNAHIFNRNKYYHVSCFEAMADLVSLIPDMFCLQTKSHNNDVRDTPAWGIMFRKWFALRGRLDVTKMERYITAHTTCHKEYVDAFLKWNKTHQGCLSRFAVGELRDGEQCDCPPEPKSELPVLRDADIASTGDERCSLANIVHHHYSNELEPRLRIYIGMYETEVQVYYPENELVEVEEEPGENKGNGNGEEDETTTTTEAAAE